MLIPSIDLMGGKVVQLEKGAELKLAFEDVDYWVQRFAGYELVQLIDLDAAMRRGENRELTDRIVSQLPCQVGGGVHTIARAQELLHAGARRVIFGSALFHGGGSEGHAGRQDRGGELVNTRFAQELKDALGSERLVFSVDTRGERVAVKGWAEQVALGPEEALRALEPFCAAFLYTHIDSEGTLAGFPMEVARRLRAITQRQLIVAGGIREQSEVDALAAMGIDAVAGMAIYLGRLAV